MQPDIREAETMPNPDRAVALTRASILLDLRNRDEAPDAHDHDPDYFEPSYCAACFWQDNVDRGSCGTAE